jgi:hypothetical protein
MRESRDDANRRPRLPRVSARLQSAPPRDRDARASETVETFKRNGCEIFIHAGSATRVVDANVDVRKRERGR